MFLKGFARSVPQSARTEFPPVDGASTYGPAAAEGARELMREARELRVNIAPRIKAMLCAIARGERPMTVRLWRKTRTYLDGRRALQTAIAEHAEHAGVMRVNLTGLRISLGGSAMPRPGQ